MENARTRTKLSISEKLPPHDTDAEEATLGSLIIDGEAINKISTSLNGEDFFDPKTKLVYEACSGLYKRNEIINQITVAQELNRRDRLESAGGPAYLAHLVSIVPTSLHVEDYAKLVKKLSVKRQIIEKCGTGAKFAYERDELAEVAIIARQIQGLTSAQSEPKLIVGQIREQTGTVHFKREAISNVVKNALLSKGSFIRSDEGRFYFLRDAKNLLALNSFEFGCLLNELFGLNPTEEDFKYIIAELDSEAHLRGQPVEIRRFTFYDSQKNLLYVDRFDGQMYRLNGREVELVSNGTDGILFMKRPEWQPFSLLEKTNDEGLVEKLLVDDVPFVKDKDCASLLPNEQKLTLVMWVTSLFFGEMLPSKPILAVVGIKGSAKTTTLRRILHFLFGPMVDVTACERNREDAFVAAITSNFLLVIDNLDGKISWMCDRLAMASTSSMIQLRRLYTTNELYTYHPTCFLAISSREPQFRRDDVADRMIILRTDRVLIFKPESEILAQLQEHRNALWTELLMTLNHIISTIQEIKEVPDTKFRMRDWASLCWRIARINGVEKDWELILEKLSREQSSFVLEDDPFYEALDRWMKEPGNNTRDVTSKELYEELRKIAIDENIEWHYASAMSLSKRIGHIKSNIEHFFNLKMRRERGLNHYAFSRLEQSEGDAVKQ